MKKLLLPLLFIGVVFAGCKKDEPKVELGTVTLDPASNTVTYGETYPITPKFSLTGEAKKKTYVWNTGSNVIASIKPDGDQGQVTAKRIGETEITYKSTDGLLTAKSKVIVEPRSNVLNGLYYRKGVTSTEITNNVSGTYAFNSAESTNKFKTYVAAGSKTITKLIYELDSSEKLEALWVILEDNSENRSSIDNYLDERFDQPEKTKEGISFYKNSGLTVYPLNTALGKFNAKTINEIDYTYGVKIMDYSYLQ